MKGGHSLYHGRMRISNQIKGFTLIELAVVLTIIGIMAYLVLPMSSVLINNKARDLSQAKLKNVEAAFLNYAIVNRRLPCPANGTIAVGNAAAGVEGARDANGDCTDNQGSGVVPYVALGLTAGDAQDAWNVLLTYRVAFGLTRNNALDMNLCDPAGTGPSTTPVIADPNLGLCTSPCTNASLSACTSPINFLVNKGFNVQDGAGNVIMNRANYSGAAYVVISHGENLFGAYLPSGNLNMNASKNIAGTVLEPPNTNGPAKTVTSAITPVFIDATYSDLVTSPTTYFDDLIIHPSLIALIQKAQLGPRSH